MNMWMNGEMGFVGLLEWVQTDLIGTQRTCERRDRQKDEEADTGRQTNRQTCGRVREAERHMGIQPCRQVIRPACR